MVKEKERSSKIDLEESRVKYYQIDRPGFSLRGWIIGGDKPVLCVPITTTDKKAIPLAEYNRERLSNLTPFQLFDKLGLRWGTDNMLLSHITESENGRSLEIKLDNLPEKQKPTPSFLVKQLRQISDFTLTSFDPSNTSTS